jgi:hypothetical protein
MKSYKVSVAFTRLADPFLVPFTNQILTSLTDNDGFPNPPFPLKNLSTQLDVFQEKLAATEDGGHQATLEKRAARGDLESLLRQLASYVQTVASEDLVLLSSSGFSAVQLNNAQIVLPKPVIAAIENAGSRQLVLRLQAVPTARAYEVRISFGTNGWESAGIFTQARRIVLQDLTPGTVYTVQVRAIGGSTGSSDWSDSVSHMSL